MARIPLFKVVLVAALGNLGSLLGTVALRDARLTFDPGRMETPDGIYTVSGTSTICRA